MCPVDFLRQMRGTNSETDFPPEFLEGIFSRVGLREFKLPVSPSVDLRVQQSRTSNGLMSFLKPDKPGSRSLSTTTSLRASEAGLATKGTMRIPEAIPSGRAMYTDENPQALTGQNASIAEKPVNGVRDPGDAFTKGSRRSICCCFTGS